MVSAGDSLSKRGKSQVETTFQKNKIFCLIGNNTNSTLHYKNQKYKNKTLKPHKTLTKTMQPLKDLSCDLTGYLR